MISQSGNLQKGLKFWCVDAFTSIPFKGNPAGVCLVENFLDVEVMQNIAMELGFSETAFVKKLDSNSSSYHIRWFTPNSEAPLCGHATIAATHVLVQENLETVGQKISFSSLSGEIFSECQVDGWVALNFPFYPPTEIGVSKILSEILQNEKPIYVGVAENCLLVEVASEEFVERAEPNLTLLKTLSYRALILTAKSTKYDFVTRYFAPRVAIDEDPVCASAQCRLVPYWSNKLEKDVLISRQLSRRGGIIKSKNLVNRVMISGEAVTVFSGRFF